tara:strand:+ start:71 stop:442 length:372 start_codon:yes stop_codon:yes gene_type:complete
MIGNLEPEENVMRDAFTQKQLHDIMATLGWDTKHDNIVLNVGGTQVSGIDVGEDYNKKWQSPKGTRKYNKDSFIVIKNLSRTPFESSQPMDKEHKPHHLKTEKEIIAELKKNDDEKGYDTYSK